MSGALEAAEVEGILNTPFLVVPTTVNYLLQRNVNLSLRNNLKISTTISVKPHFYDMGVETFLDVFLCRSQFAVAHFPTIEFNLKYSFDPRRSKNKLIHAYNLQESLRHSPRELVPLNVQLLLCVEECPRGPPLLDLCSFLVCSWPCMAARSTDFLIMVLFKYVSPCEVLLQIKKHYSHLLFWGHFDLRLEVIPTRISLTRKVCLVEGAG